MTKKILKQESFVTQSQWAEGMEMIKDFFGKIVSDISGIKEDIKDLKRDNEEIKKKVDMNSDSLALLTKDLRETEKLEVDIFKHEQRITKLEEKEKVKS